MNIDDKIIKELSDDAAEIDRILAKKDESLFSMLESSFKGSMRRWFILINVIIIMNTVALVWCMYQFFTVSTDIQTFWGILFIASLQFQIAAKQWVSNEMNRGSLVRELKRVELAIAELAEKLK